MARPHRRKVSGYSWEHILWHEPEYLNFVISSHLKKTQTQTIAIEKILIFWPRPKEWRKQKTKASLRKILEFGVMNPLHGNFTEDRGSPPGADRVAYWHWSFLLPRRGQEIGCEPGIPHSWTRSAWAPPQADSVILLPLPLLNLENVLGNRFSSFGQDSCMLKATAECLKLLGSEAVIPPLFSDLTRFGGQSLLMHWSL